VLVQAFDPRVTRGKYREGVGHSYLIEESGLIYVVVPFSDLRELSEVRIRIIDASKSREVATEPSAVVAIFDSPPDSMSLVCDISADTLKKQPAWLKVAATLGVLAEAGHFEIHLDRDRRYRWRMRRMTGDIVADSGRAFPNREACEADLQWVRQYAASLRIVALDISQASASADK